MTDFYKKYYGYEDNIKLKDDDMRILQEGMTLKKLNASKEEFNERFYKLDFNTNELVATTKEFRKKEKKYALTTFNEVKSGCSSDDLKSFKLKNILNDRKNIPNIEDLSFVIIFDNFRKSLDLLASSEAERDLWVRVLSYFIVLTKKRKGVLPEADKIMKSYFELADTSNDKKLDKNEVTEFLDSINIKLKKKQLKQLIKISDTDRDGELNEQEFELFMSQLRSRKEILSLYKLIASGEQKLDINYIPEFISVDRFQNFLERYQKEIKTLEECKKIIFDFEPTDVKNEYKLTLYGLINYLLDPHHHIQDYDKTHQVYMNMDMDFSNYFVNSSHNTYLSGDQIMSESDPNCYVAAIMRGARLLEIDCHDGSDGRPRIYHKKTLTNKILFEDVIEAIKEYAFKISSYPLILTLELHCSPPQQIIMVNVIKEHLKNYLYLEYFDDNSYPTINDLKNKIIIRCRKPMKESKTVLQSMVKGDLAQKRLSEIDDEEDENFEEVEELGDVINVVQNASFIGIDHAFQNYSKIKSSSLSESKCSKLIEEETANRILEYTSFFFTKVYPAFYRQDSGNLKPIDYWIYGFQMVALNFQTKDSAMDLNEALFQDNGQCGYVLKPRILRDPSLRFDPTDIRTMKNKVKFRIKIISGQNLPNKSDFFKDIVDPYVTVKIVGVPSDKQEKKTQTIRDNGLNPIWNEDLEFNIHCPELAFVRFIVKDEDLGSDDFVGSNAFRFENIKQGYRHVPLKNKYSKGTLFVGIRISKLD
ncbi:1-phosphatidylinositol 4-5-bisphosphate phosphodiesterase delta-1 [Brachionus plicatilis]|uniref:Phosphoinositide phospholipase C n=1 Tax=Brachionus plicatilis TaxID=10195 RepID=A0A3M7RF45_BRAPC|nr:1-phosphatidylinositol 4-5-bisphosphate phosphodiesterase delta-1 [Brachionus plicatilis]